MHEPIRVAVVEDVPSIRQALELMLDATPATLCVGTFERAEAALAAPKTLAPAVVLLDIGLPGMPGTQAIAPLKQRWPQAEVLMLTVQDDDASVFDALCQGAAGYLIKSTPMDQLLAAIVEVAQGGAPMTASIARRVVQSFRRPAPQTEPLTAREQNVLDLLVTGKSNKQIAEELFVSTHTVASHIKQIYQKLEVNSRAQAVAKTLLRP